MSSRPAFIGSLIRQLHTKSEDSGHSAVCDLLVLVSEVKGLKNCGLSKGKTASFYCEIELNGEVAGRSSCKACHGAESVFWGERFQYVNLRGLRTAAVKLYRDTSGKRKSPSSCIGHVPVGIRESDRGEFNEAWYPLEGTSRGHAYLQMRVRSSAQDLLILEPSCYMPLLDYVLADVQRVCQVLEPHLPSKSKDELAQTLVYILKANRQVVHFISSVLVLEVETLERENLILRANSFASKSIDCYMKLTGTDYLKELLTPVLLYIVHGAPDCEVDPTRLLDSDSKTQLDANKTILLSIVERVWTTIYQGLQTFPRDLRFIFSDVRKRVADRGETMWKRIVSGTVFLRYFCPAILSPSLFHITYQYPDERACRRLTLVAKVIQNLANATRFGSKEAYMIFFNDFMDREMPTMDIYLNQVSSAMEYSPDLETHGVETLTELSTYDLQAADLPSQLGLARFEDMPQVSSRTSKQKINMSTSSESANDRKPVITPESTAPPNRNEAILQRILAYHLPRLDPVATSQLDVLIALVAQLQADIAVERARAISPGPRSDSQPSSTDRRTPAKKRLGGRGESFPYLPMSADEEPPGPARIYEKHLSDLDLKSNSSNKSVEINM